MVAEAVEASVEARTVTAAEGVEAGTVDRALEVESRNTAEEVVVVVEGEFRPLMEVERFVPQPVRELSGRRGS